MTRNHTTTDPDAQVTTDDADRAATDESRTDPGGGRVDRRDYLRLIGGVGMAGAAGSIAGQATAQSDDWEAAADERIREHRQGLLTVAVVDENGQPVPDATVEVAMQSHDYWFGYAMSADLLDQTDPGHPYREALKEDFNVVWFGNNHKWRFFEENQERADRATAWAKDNGLDIRGHVCLWANVNAWPIPGDVVDAMGLDHQSGESGPDFDAQHVEDRSFEHVQTIIDHYADFEYDGTSYGSVIDEWEVMNEVVHEPGFIKAVNGVPAPDDAPDIDPVTDPVLADYYQHARDVAPDDVGLAVNDYNTMEGSYEYARSDYERQIEFLAANGHLDYVGIQSHFTEQSTTVSPQEALEVLDRYAQHGVRLRVTEYDATGDDWSDDEKADFFGDYLKAVFSHEATDAFLTAGGSDEHHWRDDGPFFYAGWDPKPAYEVYQNLVFDEWWTDTAETTGEDGTATVDAFLGTHEVRVETTDGTTVTETVSITDSDAGRQITVTVDGSTADGPNWVSEPAPTDPDGDGLYEDVSGDGDLNFPDVNRLFQTTESTEVQDNAEYLDFDGDGDADLQDVLALFEMV
ncbi:endo-1,4-beta-xylanase [Halococcoides cellulosivorans]|uniref:endo-1,4-beta-xylanase n=1 Tax=Halococcoides cellulosivorans TaxID=1679096 RepID=A0A2R4WYP9_9EURY|nr:endo-1,4-beta-xylanase [Halococcoides cellulosivorans]AWB26670.1 hypothetical protein HARCEL1_02555 [Halococcoides cellulosivorans]